MYKNNIRKMSTKSEENVLMFRKNSKENLFVHINFNFQFKNEFKQNRKDVC